MRTIIIGGPRTGKTTLALELAAQRDCRVYHTDDLMHLGWSEASDHAASCWVFNASPYVLEGVAAARALRKAMRICPGARPCDEVLLRWAPKVALTPGQAAMGKGVETVWREIETQVRTLGVSVRAVG